MTRAPKRKKRAAGERRSSIDRRSGLDRRSSAGRSERRPDEGHYTFVSRRPAAASCSRARPSRSAPQAGAASAPHQAADKLHADWQARLRKGKRQANRRLASDVLQRREGNVIGDRRPTLHQIGLLEVDRADLHRRRCEDGRDPGVVRLLPSATWRDTPCKLAQQSWYCAAVMVLPN